jgi:DNA-binding beta-propeller fold protein YncE
MTMNPTTRFRSAGFSVPLWMLVAWALLVHPGIGLIPKAFASPVVFPAEWIGDIERSDAKELKEPSGICFHLERGTLFLVGDNGDVAEFRTDGTRVKERRVQKADFEGITHDPSTGLLYVAVEGKDNILELDPDNLKVLREFNIPRSFEGRKVMKKGGSGIEAITFVPDPDHPEGGTFVVANQSFDLEDEEDRSVLIEMVVPIRSGRDKVEILRVFEPGVIDLSGLYHDGQTGNLFVVSDASNAVLEIDPEHRIVGAWAFPGNDQEGIAADADGFLYLAQDSGGIIKLNWRRDEKKNP